MRQARSMRKHHLGTTLRATAYWAGMAVFGVTGGTALREALADPTPFRFEGAARALSCGAQGGWPIRPFPSVWLLNRRSGKGISRRAGPASANTCLVPSRTMGATTIISIVVPSGTGGSRTFACRDSHRSDNYGHCRSGRGFPGSHTKPRS